jgi:hypothetical protein
VVCNYNSTKLLTKCRSRSFLRIKIKPKPRLVLAYIISTSTLTAISSTSQVTLSTVLIVYRNFYQMRLDKLRNAEIARRNRERLNNPANFPSVPSGNP